MIKYAEKENGFPCELKEEGNPLPRLDSQGYTLKGGSPTRYKALFKGRWYRVYCVQFSNAGSNFIKVNGENLYL